MNNHFAPSWISPAGSPINDLMTMQRLYPYYIFPRAAQEALYEMWENSQAPVELVGMSILAVMSSSLQAMIDVCLPIGNTVPVSLYMLAIADSGERKSWVERPIARAIFDVDQYQQENYKAALSAYGASMRIWKAKERALLSMLGTYIKRGNPIEAIEQALQDHLATEPIKPRQRRILRSDISSLALIEALEGDGESIAFLTGEGGLFVNGGALKQVDLLNECWSGVQSLSVDRAHGKRREVRNPRVTISFMVPEGVLKDFEKRRARVLRESGHWARYLVAKPVSTQGWRDLYSTDLVWNHLPTFQAHARTLLDEHARRMESGLAKRKTLYFNPAAKELWRETGNLVERQLRPGAYLFDVKDFSSKSMELVARLAALLHCYAINVEQVIAGDVGEISFATLDNAIKIADWHLHEYKRIFAPQSLVTQLQADAQRLEEYLYTQIWRAGLPCIRKNIVRQFGPVREKDRLNAALDTLQSLGCIYIGIGGNGEKYINLVPFYFSTRGPFVQ